MANRQYDDGFDAGAEAATFNLSDPPSLAKLKEAFAEDRLGEIAGEIREHQAQFAGDISEDVGRRGGLTARQFEKWEEGFVEGFVSTVEQALRSLVSVTPPDRDESDEDEEDDEDEDDE